MSARDVLNSKSAVRFSILIGRYMPKGLGYWLASRIASLITSFQNLEINQAVRANQYVVRGERNSRQELVQFSKQVLEHAGRCYYDLYNNIDQGQQLEDLVPFTETMRNFIKLSQGDQGYLVVAPHLSNFDLVVSRLVKEGFKGKVMSYPDPGKGYQLQNQIRANYGLDLTPLGEPGVEAAMVSYLKGGGVVATGVDRPLPSRKKKHFVNFFGRPSPLPLGYITTALSAGVPIVAVSAIMEPNGTYSFRHSETIHLKQYKNKLDTILLNAERVLQEIEKLIKLAPEQWLMYYPVWPDLMGEL